MKARSASERRFIKEYKTQPEMKEEAGRSHRFAEMEDVNFFLEKRKGKAWKRTESNEGFFFLV